MQKLRNEQLNENNASEVLRVYYAATKTSDFSDMPDPGAETTLDDYYQPFDEHKNMNMCLLR